ncbi:uncharacterized protein UDID_12237 [Ustilago sp. UG-2017a]|nr:uncharacterized protein UDID_12237 [Ustilago sp. UG-2017a]
MSDCNILSSDQHLPPPTPSSSPSPSTIFASSIASTWSHHSRAPVKSFVLDTIVLDTIALTPFRLPFLYDSSPVLWLAPAPSPDLKVLITDLVPGPLQYSGPHSSHPSSTQDSQQNPTPAKKHSGSAKFTFSGL